MPVFLLLHVAKTGRVSSIERWRGDGSAIRDLEPEIGRVQVKPMAALREGERWIFSIDDGWQLGRDNEA
jgi:hypothetical protein